MKIDRKKLLYPRTFTGKWAPVFLWAVVIFFFSSLPQQTASQFFVLDFIIKKTAHISEYAILYALFLRALGYKFMLAFIFSLAYAATDEIHQHFIPGRTARLYDIFGFDLFGISISAFVLWKLKQLRRAKP